MYFLNNKHIFISFLGFFTVHSQHSSTLGIGFIVPGNYVDVKKGIKVLLPTKRYLLLKALKDSLKGSNKVPDQLKRVSLS